MTSQISARDFLQIRDASRLLGVSTQTLRNWDRTGKLTAHRHPINGYRMYKVGDLREVLRGLDELPDRLSEDGLARQLAFSLDDNSDIRQANGSAADEEKLPPCHWKVETALDPKHRPQRWDAPSTTVRRDWRKFPQEAHFLDETGRKYRRFTVAEIATLQGFDSSVADLPSLTDRQRIAALGDAVPPPVSTALITAISRVRKWETPTALEICAGIGGLAEGAAAGGLEHIALIDNSSTCGELLANNRRWRPDRVQVEDITKFDFASLGVRIGLLSGGLPCQPWSQSGLRLGINDQRDLLTNAPDLLGEVEPEVFLFENVPGVATIDDGSYLEALVARLRRPRRNLRYGVLLAYINAADFGVPQVRRRIFMLGFKDLPGVVANRCFDVAQELSFYADPSAGRVRQYPWKTVGAALHGMPDPGGWRRWIGGFE